MRKTSISKKSYLFTWITIIAVSLSILSCGNKEEEQDEKPPEETIVEEDTPAELPAPIAGYINYVDNNDALKSMELDHNYTSRSVKDLINSVNWLSAEHDIDLDWEKESLLEKAEELQKDPYSLIHADIIADIFSKTADGLCKIQNSVKPGMNDMCDKLKNDANAIVPQKPLLDQKAEVKEYLDQASKVLKALTS